MQEKEAEARRPLIEAQGRAAQVEAARIENLQQHSLIANVFGRIKGLKSPEAKANAFREGVRAVGAAGGDVSGLENFDVNDPQQAILLEEMVQTSDRVVKTLQKPKEFGETMQLAHIIGSSAAGEGRMLSEDELIRRGLLLPAINKVLTDEEARRKARTAQEINKLPPAVKTRLFNSQIEGTKMLNALAEVEAVLADPETGELRFEDFLGVFPRGEQFDLKLLADRDFLRQLSPEQRRRADQLSEFAAAVGDIQLELFHEKFGSTQTKNETGKAINKILGDRMTAPEFKAAFGLLKRKTKRVMELNSLFLNQGIDPASNEFADLMDRMARTEASREKRRRGTGGDPTGLTTAAERKRNLGTLVRRTDTDPDISKAVAEEVARDGIQAIPIFGDAAQQLLR